MRATAVFLALFAVSVVAAAAVPAGMSYDAMLTAGHKIYVGGDAKGALEKYEAAKEAESGLPGAYYFVGMAKAKLGEFDAAIAALNTAATISGDKDVALHAKTLFALAVVQEQKGSWDAALEAWNTYLGYAQSHTNVRTFVDSAKSRIAAIEKRRELEKEGAATRSRAEGGGQK